MSTVTSANHSMNIAERRTISGVIARAGSRLAALRRRRNETVEHEAREIFRVFRMQQPHGMWIAPPAPEVHTLWLHGKGNERNIRHGRGELRKGAPHVIVRRHQNQTSIVMRL